MVLTINKFSEVNELARHQINCNLEGNVAVLFLHSEVHFMFTML